MSKTVLIFGISSFVGSNLAEVLRKKYRVIGTYYSQPVTVKGLLTIKCDVLSKDQVSNIIAIFKPDITIYAVGLSSLMKCHLDPKKADALNSAGVVNVASMSERFQAQFIYLSSAMVMSGEDILFKEGDTPFPITVYGVTVSQSEFYIQKSCLNYLIFRCGKFYGRSLGYQNLNWLEVVEKKILEGGVLNIDDSLQIGFMDIQLFAERLIEFIETEMTNKLIHFSSQDVCTYYDFTVRLLKELKYENISVLKKEWPFPLDENQIKLAKQLQRYTFHLDNSNAELVLDKKNPTIQDSIEYTARRFLAS